MPDLLEAAAAYLSDVEGKAEFSRAMLMAKIQECRKAEFSREERLRFFGALLHRNKLQKLDSGYFTVTGRTGYRIKALNTG